MAGRPLREIRGSFGGVSGLDILHLVERAIMGLLLCIPGDGPTIHDESTPGKWSAHVPGSHGRHRCTHIFSSCLMVSLRFLHLF